MKSIMELLEEEKNCVYEINAMEEDVAKSFFFGHIEDNKKELKKNALNIYLSEYDAYCRDEEADIFSENYHPVNFATELYIRFNLDDDAKISYITSFLDYKEGYLNWLYMRVKALRTEIKKALDF